MKKISFVLSAAAIAAANLGIGTINTASANENQTFSSYGQCRSALAKTRNETRQGEGLFGPGYTGSFNAWVRYHYECVEVDRNVWVILRV